MATGSSGRGRVWWVALLFAGVAGVGVLVAGLLLPFYSSDSVSSSGRVLHDSATLVDVNGAGIVVVLAVPLAAAVLVAGALLLRRHRGALAVAWTLTSLLALFNLLAMLTIGLFVVPVTAALVVACAAASRPQAPAAVTA